ncbi:MAG TPA: hypothetical protein VF406_04620 [Thermodesulfobacteriota bacterium]
MRRAALLVVLLLAACGGGGGGGGGSGTDTPAAPRGPWAGTWLLSTARPSGGFNATCVGAFPPSRYPLWDPLGAPVVCGLDQWTMRQAGSALTLEPVAFLCSTLTPAQTVTVSGSGTVVPDAGTGSVTREVRFPDGSAWTASYQLLRTGGAVTLTFVGADAPGGTCTITPPAPWSATIAP